MSIRQAISRILPRAVKPAVISVQLFCVLHLVNYHLVEVRPCAGASMLPTLAMSGDCLVHLRLPVAKLVESLPSRFSSPPPPPQDPYHEKYIGGPTNSSKRDPSQGTGLKLGDLVVATSPVDPTRTVCKRVLGLAGDTICVDPRMRPVAESCWKGQQRPPPTTESNLFPESKTISYQGFLHDSKGDATRHNQPSSSSSTHSNVGSKGDVQYVTIPTGHVWLIGDNLANSTDSRHYGPVPLGLVRGKVIARIYPNPAWMTNNMRTIE